MRCIHCGHTKTRPAFSRSIDDKMGGLACRKHRRNCKQCGRGFETLEFHSAPFMKFAAWAMTLDILPDKEDAAIMLQKLYRK